MKVLVTGGAGYIGSHVVLELISTGHKVIILDDLSLGSIENVHTKAEFIKGSTLDESILAKVLSREVNAVIHLAAFKAAGESMTNPEKYSKNNIIGTAYLLNAMMKQEVNRFVFSSTAAVYGFPEYLPVDEKHPLKPINYYGFTKKAIEDMLQWYNELKGMRFAALRYFNAAGYDINGECTGLENNPQNLLPIVMEVASGRRKMMDIFGNDYHTRDGTGIRDYIHVNDLASAHVKSLRIFTRSFFDNCEFWLQEGDNSVLDVIHEAEHITGKKINNTSR